MKRFYQDVAVVEQDGGWRVTLDGRPLKSVGGRLQVVPSRGLAEGLASEWAGQGEQIDPARFVYRDMTDYAIDVVGPDRAQAIRELLPYGETDTLCYRAEPGDSLRREQDRVWEPLLVAAEARHGLAFTRIGGVIHRPQPAGTMARLETILAEADDFGLAALRNLAGLAASLVIGLAALEDGAAPEALWLAANLEEDWQAERWGHDAEAAARRERRREAFLAAATFARLARG
ncbi:ATP12 family chaperone protein [Novosphingobium piscinae]|uniref:Molecular chaperone n=1 Tax=Novosphingobium piscinae TaxID=1507448 RepID=A0A7X1G0J8_9SPHN|nr:ATP12 family protein [Novosphingobium piscinae]MBC2670445.1 molecular chaperone [Novosphingobium piscinae]